MSQAVRQHEGVQTVRTKLRQAALTALAERPTDRWEQIWRAACLGALVREIYQLNLTSNARPEAEESLACPAPTHSRPRCPVHHQRESPT
ncbi:hypothetical protein OOK36_35525 [Streptomyces sp. NBC_00365]|uniref:hypothetical protein n=1 Tax=Streptomyces sp. NBC_00365 TaxID=2975726 RepID=UPI0022587B17|nr:hypothetical protein [Streptomyces sp. NBC_00365]MCX5094084.1 hypothetical protein [Streptomyces sp. NBC_00365]